jgi:hypothetical protein
MTERKMDVAPKLEEEGKNDSSIHTGLLTTVPDSSTTNVVRQRFNFRFNSTRIVNADEDAAIATMRSSQRGASSALSSLLFLRVQIRLVYIFTCAHDTDTLLPHEFGYLIKHPSITCICTTRSTALPLYCHSVPLLSFLLFASTFSVLRLDYIQASATHVPAAHKLFTNPTQLQPCRKSSRRPSFPNHNAIPRPPPSRCRRCPRHDGP